MYTFRDVIIDNVLSCLALLSFIVTFYAFDNVTAHITFIIFTMPIFGFVVFFMVTDTLRDTYLYLKNFSSIKINRNIK